MDNIRNVALTILAITIKKLRAIECGKCRRNREKTGWDFDNIPKLSNGKFNIRLIFV